MLWSRWCSWPPLGNQNASVILLSLSSVCLGGTMLVIAAGADMGHSEGLIGGTRRQPLVRREDVQFTSSSSAVFPSVDASLASLDALLDDGDEDDDDELPEAKVVKMHKVPEVVAPLVIASYGYGSSANRLVNEKAACMGACITNWSKSTVSNLDNKESIPSKVHGLFGAAAKDANGTAIAPSVQSSHKALGKHKLLRVSMIFWAVGAWSSGDIGFVKIDGLQVWSKARTASDNCMEWSECAVTVAAAPPVSCCQLVSKTINHDSNTAKIEIGAKIDEDATHESFGFSDFALDIIDIPQADNETT
eukprot:TRINITY_DN68534_c0_g1_i1.p1 TRINITY_DN68534_c0_g1~~TRINITY_DN68534_c0_g1_i1.p1  ORF type:complete len:305 (-),score=53.39 TRINITY_DN68534_c0_g1_i1:347-1261(-)